MRGPRIQSHALRGVERVLLILSGLLVLLWMAIGANWLLVLTTPPARHAQESVDLTDYGLDGVSLRMVYPSRLVPDQSGENAQSLVILASASSQAAVRSFEMRLALESDAVGFVDPSGEAVAGRLDITPGYPDALPYSLSVAHGNTQLDGGLLTPCKVSVQPVILVDGVAREIPELAFAMALPSRAERGLRAVLAAVQDALLPYVIGGTLLVLAVWVALATVDRWRFRDEQHLSRIYGQLQEYVRSERWPDARRAIEQIRVLEPGYRDVVALATQVSREEDALWRRERLFREGVTAYRERDWSRAVRNLSLLQDIDPYYRDVQFLHRTSALYADLQSRDRSRRVAALEALGQIGDLVDWEPLIEALGDPNEHVQEAAVRALSACGMQAFEALLGGLTRESSMIRSNAYRVLESHGQRAREQLLSALRSSDPTISSAVARLLVHLGARQELAESLLWLGDEHVRGVVSALVSAGTASAAPLIDVLLRAPVERQPRVVDAIVSLGQKADITRHLSEAFRATKDPAEREILTRAMEADAVCQGLEVGGGTRQDAAGAPRGARQLEERAASGGDAERGRNPLSRLFDRRDS